MSLTNFMPLTAATHPLSLEEIVAQCSGIDAQKDSLLVTFSDARMRSCLLTFGDLAQLHPALPKVAFTACAYHARHEAAHCLRLTLAHYRCPGPVFRHRGQSRRLHEMVSLLTYAEDFYVTGEFISYTVAKTASGDDYVRHIHRESLSLLTDLVEQRYPDLRQRMLLAETLGCSTRDLVASLQRAGDNVEPTPLDIPEAIQ